MYSLEFWLNIFLSVVLISIFICIFFFTYASKVERDIIVSQTKDLVTDLSVNITDIPGVQQTLQPYIDSWEPPNTSADDAKVDAANKALLIQAVSLIATFAVTSLLVITILAYLYKISFVRLFVPNLIILLFVGLTEFFFLRCIASNYISFDPNYAAYQILQTLYNYSQQP